MCSIDWKKAKKLFLGLENGKRYNCAQAIIEAFRDYLKIDEELVKQFENYGFGGAPKGECGAFYAAMHIIKKLSPEKIKKLENYFIEIAGSKKCREIRIIKKIGCVKCVEKTAEFLECLENGLREKMV